MPLNPSFSDPDADPDRWGADPLSEEISSQVAAMPDRPKVVLVIISSKDEDDSVIISNMVPHKAAFINVHAVQVFEIPYRFFYFGFEHDTPVGLSEFMATLAAVPFMEAALFVDGAPTLRLSKLKLVQPQRRKRQY